MDLSALIVVVPAMVVIGLFAGFLAGLLGVGGGIVLVPAFFYAFQYMGFTTPDIMQMCLATSLATIVVTSLRSLQSHHAKGAVHWDVLKSWSPGIAVGAILGVWLAADLSSAVLQAIFGILGAVIGLYMLGGKSDWALADVMPVRVARWAWAAGIGFLSVLLGIGGGSLGVPFMTLHRVAIHNAVATAAGFGLAIAVPSVIGWMFVSIEGPTPPLMLGAISLPAFLIIVPLTFLAAPYGAKAAHAMNPKPLKRAFGAFLCLVALNMLLSAFWT